MSFDLLTIGPSSEACRAAPLLAKAHHVHLLADQATPPPAGFYLSPLAVDLWRPTSGPADALVEAEVAALCEEGLALELTDLASFGLERCIESIYFPLLVAHGYAEEACAAPLNLTNFRRSVGPRTLLALASWRDRLVGAALLQDSLRSKVNFYSHSELGNTAGHLDLIATVTTSPLSPACFEHAAHQMLASEGYTWVRRREAPWLTTTSLSRWRGIEGGGAVLAWEEGPNFDYLSWSEERLKPEEGLLSFGIGEGGLEVKVWGAPAPWPVFPDLRRPEGRHGR